MSEPNISDDPAQRFADFSAAYLRYEQTKRQSSSVIKSGIYIVFTGVALEILPSNIGVAIAAGICGIIPMFGGAVVVGWQIKSI